MRPVRKWDGRRGHLLVTAVVLSCYFASCSSQHDYELVEISSIDPSIVVDLRYATAHNFVGKVLYREGRCVLRRMTAERLSRAQKRLQRQGFGLKIWDGYRPLSVQREMWALVPDSRYVANPERGSRHNRGAAVDVTLVDANGVEVSMPTAFDDFSERAAATFADLPDSILVHRRILQEAMTAEGFTILDSEWWHFDDPNWQRCELLDIPVEKVGNK